MKLFTLDSAKLLCQHNINYLSFLNSVQNRHLEQHFNIEKSEQITDMCFIKENKRETVICLYSGLSGIYARNWSNKLLWSVDGAVDGKTEIRCVSVATDGRGHLFVCDEANQCIQLFSTDGLYIGRLIKCGEHLLGVPRLVRWCKKTSSLIIAHLKTIRGAHGWMNYMYISVIKLTF